MPKIVEIDEDELGRLRTLQRTLGTIVAHPEARKMVQKAHKLVDPNVAIPEIDAESSSDKRFAEVSKKLGEMEKQLADEKVEKENKTKLDAVNNQITTGISKLRRDGWTDEGIKGVEKIMEEKGILDPEIAAAYFEKMHPPSAPATPAGGPAWNFMDLPTEGEDDLKKLVESRGESDPALRKLIQTGLDEVRGPSRR